jgi:hypothetical protein
MDWHEFVANAVRRHRHKAAVIANLGRRAGDGEDGAAAQDAAAALERPHRANPDPAERERRRRA